MKRIHYILLGTLIATTATVFGGKLTDDVFKLGKEGTSDPVVIEFDTDDGATNVKLEAQSGQLELQNGALTNSEITNSDIDLGTASDSQRLTVSKDSTANLGALTRKEGTIFYDTTQGAMVVDNGSDLVPIGTSTPGGELNSNENPNAAVNTDGYATVGGTGTLARAESEVNSPLGSIVPSYFVFGGTTSTHGVETCLPAPQAFRNVKLKVAFYYTHEGAGVANDWEVEVQSADSADCLTNPTLVTLDGGETTAPIGGGTGYFQASFDADDSPYYQIRWKRVQGTSNIRATGIALSNGSPALGAAVGPWVAIPDSSVSSLITNIEAEGGYYRRVGDSMEVRASIEFSGANTEIVLSPIVPDGKTPDLTKFFQGFTDTTDRPIVGNWHLVDRSQSRDSYAGSVFIDVGSGSLELGGPVGLYDNVNPNTNDPIVFADGDVISWTYTIPIAEWQGEGTVNLYSEDNLTEWEDFTPSFNAGITATNVTAKKKRVGDSLQIIFKGDLNSVGSNLITFQVPDSLGVNLTQNSVVGQAVAFDQGVGRYDGHAFVQGAGEIRFLSGDGTSNVWGNPATDAPMTWVDGDQLMFSISLPITEWQNSQNALVGFAAASETNGGLVTTGAQVWSGDKKISKSSNALFGLESLETNVSNNDIFGSIQFESNDASTDASGVRAEIRGQASHSAGGIGAGAITFHATPQSTNTLTEVMRIDASGNVGIGSAAPSEKLQVEGRIQEKNRKIFAGDTSASPIDIITVATDNGSGVVFLKILHTRNNTNLRGGEYHNALTQWHGSTKGSVTFNTEMTVDVNINPPTVVWSGNTLRVTFDSTSTGGVYIIEAYAEERSGTPFTWL